MRRSTEHGQPIGYWTSKTFRGSLVSGLLCAVLTYVVVWSQTGQAWDWRALLGSVAGMVLGALPPILGRRNSPMQPLRIAGGRGKNPYEPSRYRMRRAADRAGADVPPPSTFQGCIGWLLIGGLFAAEIASGVLKIC